MYAVFKRLWILAGIRITALTECSSAFWPAKTRPLSRIRPFAASKTCNHGGLITAMSLNSDDSDFDEQYSTKNEELIPDEYCSVMDDFGCEAYEDLAKSIDEKVYRWIRVEAGEDDSLADIQTKETVLKKIEEVRLQQEQYGPSQLYTRKWKSRTESMSNDYDDHGIPTVINGSGPQVVGSFSVLQFNALAEGLSSGSDLKTPFPVDSGKESGDGNRPNDPGYGGFTQVPYPEICLDFSLRRWRILEVILGIGCVKHVGGSSVKSESDFQNSLFDILALEEIDRFRGFFAPLLRIFGYEGIFMPKSKAPGIPLGYYSDGCALFWKTDKFELISENRLKFKLGNQVVIIATLKHLASGEPVLIAVTHLKAQKSETNEKIRCMQVEELIEYVEEAATKEAQKRNLVDMPVLIMGDFNADPPLDAAFADSSVKRVLANNDRPAKQAQNPIRFKSAYPIDPPENGFFTTWKTRGNNTVKRIIDYIFYSDRLTCTESLDIPSSEELEEGKLPGLRYPSDHLMIAGRFELLK